MLGERLERSKSVLPCTCTVGWSNETARTAFAGAPFCVAERHSVHFYCAVYRKPLRLLRGILLIFRAAAAVRLG